MGDGKRKNQTTGVDTKTERSPPKRVKREQNDESKPNNKKRDTKPFNAATNKFKNNKFDDNSSDKKSSGTQNSKHKGKFSDKLQQQQRKRRSDDQEQQNNYSNNKKHSSSYSNNSKTMSRTQQHREQKQARQSQRKHADVVSHAKALWNKLRLKQQTSVQRRELLQQLLPLLKGKVMEICLQHDAARVVQAALQFGNVQERRLLIDEMTVKPGTVAELAKCQYAHFCILKAIQYTSQDEYCTSRILKNIIQGTSPGSVPKLAIHAVGCRVIEALFTTLSNKKLVPLKMELFGPHVALFAAGMDNNNINNNTNNNNTDAKTNEDSTKTVAKATPAMGTLEGCLESIPEHRDVTIAFVRDLIHKGMDKTLFSLNFFQELMREYNSVVSGAQIRALLAHNNSGRGDGGVGDGDGGRGDGGGAGHASPCDHAVHLLSSRAGAKVLCDWIAYGTTKDRRTIAKSLKGFARQTLLHPHGSYLALIRLIQLTDDTVVLHKFILSELIEHKTTPAVPTTSTTTTTTTPPTQAIAPPTPNTAVITTNERNGVSETKAGQTAMTISSEKDSTAVQNYEVGKDNDDGNNNIKEQQHPLLALALSEQASKFLLFILLLQNHDALRKVLDPYDWSVLQPGVIPTLKTSNAGRLLVEGQEAPRYGDGDNDKDGIPTSKKDVAVRQKDLFQYFQKPLIDLCTQHAQELVLSRSGSVVLRHVYQIFRPPSVVHAVVAAVVPQQPATTTREDETVQPNQESILQDRIGHLSIKNLILADMVGLSNKNDKSGTGGGGQGKTTNNSSKTKPPEPLFTRAFWETMMQQQQPQSSQAQPKQKAKPSSPKQAKSASAPWTTLALSGNRGAFVVAALVQVLKAQGQLDENRKNMSIDLDQVALQQRLQVHDDKDATTKKDKDNRESPAPEPMHGSTPSSDGMAGLRALLKEIQEGTEKKSPPTPKSNTAAVTVISDGPKRRKHQQQRGGRVKA